MLCRLEFCVWTAHFGKKRLHCWPQMRFGSLLLQNIYLVVYFSNIQLNEQIFPQIPHIERFVLVYTSYQLDKGKKSRKSHLKKSKNTALFLHLSIHAAVYYSILYSRNFVRSKHLAVFLNRFSKETCKRTSLKAAQCYKIWEKLCDNVCFGNIYCWNFRKLHCFFKKNLRALCCDEQACL